MKFLKTVFALLFSVSLMASQTVFIAQAEPASAEKCQCCSCKSNCCMAQPMPGPQTPIPTQPARAVSQTQVQFIATVVSTLVQSPIVSSQNTSPASCPVSYSSDVPLFVRNCSFLI